jgi:hypothetical protein
MDFPGRKNGAASVNARSGRGSQRAAQSLAGARALERESRRRCLARWLARDREMCFFFDRPFRHVVVGREELHAI